MGKVLELIDVSKSYDECIVLDHVSFSIHEGELIGVVGPKRSGKTTLANIITGKMKRYDGTVKKFCNNYIGYIGDKFNFYSFKTGMDNLKYIASRHNLSINQVIDIIRFLNIKIDLNEKVKNYSLAMKRKLALIAELIKNPKVIIFDEVTNGLTSLELYEVKLCIKNIIEQKNISVLLISDMVSELEKMCYKIIILQNGRIQDSIDVNNISSSINKNIFREL